jgi:TQXA domain-containing protein
MASRLKLARAGAAVAGASVALMLSAALPAGADPAKGDVDKYENGYHVNVGGGDRANLSTSLIGFKLTDGTKLQMYCVEIDTSIDREHSMVEQPWDKYPNAESPFHKNRDKINWVLHNGYPVIGADELAETLTEKGAELNGGIDEKEAISATQAAVWHYSDNTKLDKSNPLPGNDDKGTQDDVIALYDYLTGDANVGIGDQPTPALAISPAEQSGEAGTRIGPFTVNTTGDIDELKANLPEGVKITDVDGVELTADKIKNNAQLYLDVPKGAEAGEGGFELTAKASVDTGRLFVGEKYSDKHKTQSLIVATADKSELTAAAKGAWTEATTPPSSTTTAPPSTTETVPTTETTTSEAPAPQPKNTSEDLAETGASVFTPILIGVVLVGAGVGALLFLRHRKRA